MISLTPRQQECLVLIKSHLKNHGIAPSFSEIKTHFGMSGVNTVYSMLDGLVIAGHILRHVGMARGIELLETDDHHASDCDCRGCAHARYLAQLKLIQGLKIDPPSAVRSFLLRSRSDNLRMLDEVTRRDFLGTKAAPRTRTALPLGGGR